MSESSKILKSYLDKKRQLKSSYSMRALARDLKVAPSFLSAVMSGKRKLPKRFYKSIQSLLDISPDDMARIRMDRLDEEDFPSEKPKKSKTDITEWKLVPTRSFLSHWYLPALLDLMGCETFKSDIKWISKKLRITQAEVDFALRELQRLELVAQDKKTGRWQKIDRLIRMTSSESKVEFRKFHAQVLKKALEELATDKGSDHRQISGITLSLSTKQIPYLKKRLSDFFHEVAKELENTAGEDVFYLGVNFFPLTEVE